MFAGMFEGALVGFWGGISPQAHMISANALLS